MHIHLLISLVLIHAHCPLPLRDRLFRFLPSVVQGYQQSLFKAVGESKEAVSHTMWGTAEHLICVLCHVM